MTRTIQIGTEVVVMNWTEANGKITLGKMSVVPSVIYKNYLKGFRYDKI
jgi:hypothetical protein